MPLFDPQALEQRYTTPIGETAHRFQSLALQAIKDLGDKPSFTPRYMRCFRIAAEHCIDLQELVTYCNTHARGPAGAYFLNEAEILLGLKKRKRVDK